MSTTSTHVFGQDDLVELLSDDAELLAFADAIAVTQAGGRGTASKPPGSLRRRGGYPRRLIVAVAVLGAVLLAVGATLAATVGGFSSWLTGTPGTPASPAVQKQFQASSAQSYEAFPAGTVLHQLIVERVGGATYRLYGFSYGDELCLRLVAQGISGQPAMSCAPRLSLEDARVPVQVADVDYPFDLGKPTHSLPRGSQHLTLVPPGARLPDHFSAPAASASFGFVANGVTNVVLMSGKQRQRAVVADNVFLAVRLRPAVGSVVSAVTAMKDGRTVSIPFAKTLIGAFPKASTGPIPGPKKVQHQLGPGSISWITHHQPLGQSLAQAHIPRQRLIGYHQAGGIAFARVIRPDPQSTIRVVVSLIGKHGRNLCLITYLGGASGGGCSLRLAPISAMEMSSLYQGGNQFEVISGLARDGVAKIDLYLSDGERWPVPLTDNAYAIAVPRDKLVAELVAYDVAGQIVGITPERGF